MPHCTLRCMLFRMSNSKLERLGFRHLPPSAAVKYHPEVDANVIIYEVLSTTVLQYPQEELN